MEEGLIMKKTNKTESTAEKPPVRLDFYVLASSAFNREEHFTEETFLTYALQNGLKNENVEEFQEYIKGFISNLIASNFASEITPRLYGSAIFRKHK